MKRFQKWTKGGGHILEKNRFGTIGNDWDLQFEDKDCSSYNSCDTKSTKVVIQLNYVKQKVWFERTLEQYWNRAVNRRPISLFDRAGLAGSKLRQYQSFYHRSYSASLIFNLSCISMCICKGALNSNHSIIAFFSWEERWSCIQGLGINSTFFQQLLAHAVQELTGHHQYHRCLRCSWISTFSGSCGHCNLVASWCLDWLGLTFKRRKS